MVREVSLLRRTGIIQALPIPLVDSPLCSASFGLYSALNQIKFQSYFYQAARNETKGENADCELSNNTEFASITPKLLLSRKVNRSGFLYLMPVTLYSQI